MRNQHPQWLKVWELIAQRVNETSLEENPQEMEVQLQLLEWCILLQIKSNHQLVSNHLNILWFAWQTLRLLIGLTTQFRIRSSKTRLRKKTHKRMFKLTTLDMSKALAKLLNTQSQVPQRKSYLKTLSTYYHNPQNHTYKRSVIRQVLSLSN